MAVAMLLMTQLRADTPVPIVWLWMFIAGLGVGPTFAVFTLVVQNAVPFHFLGVATSNLTFFRQIGGSVALAIVGTVFSTEIVKQLPVQVGASGMSPASLGQIGQAAQSGNLDFNQLIGTGDLATKVQGAFPTMPADDVAKFVSSVLSAFSLAVSQTFWIGVVGRGPRGHRGPGDEGACPHAAHPGRGGRGGKGEGCRRRAVPTDGAGDRVTRRTPPPAADPTNHTDPGGLARRGRFMSTARSGRAALRVR